MLDVIKNYARNSGVTITLRLNPFHWKLIPQVVKLPEFDKWAYSDNYRGIKIDFLFVQVVAQLDDGYPDNLF